MRSTSRAPEHLFRLILVLSICSQAPACYESSVGPWVSPDAIDYYEDRRDPLPEMDDRTEDVLFEDPAVDPPVDEVVPCPPDDPPQHIYINVDGTVLSLDRATPVAGTFTGAISPLDALTNPTPTPIGASSVGADGAFSMICVDVGPVALGLVILHDDDPTLSEDRFYPTGTAVAGWFTVEDRIDVADAAVFAVSQDLAAGIEALASVHIDADGLAMGIVLDGATGMPIRGAAVIRLGGDALDIVYPTADFSGLETDGDTSASGVFIMAQPVTALISDVTAAFPGYTFDQYTLATKSGFIFFVVIVGRYA